MKDGAIIQLNRQKTAFSTFLLHPDDLGGAEKGTKDERMDRCLFFHIPHIENGKARVLLFDGLPHFLLDDSISHTGCQGPGSPRPSVFSSL